jgi:Binding-protein-dependent transport system inner membrane component
LNEGVAVAGVTFDGVANVYPDGTRAVNHFDLDIKDGEFMVLVGPSGCGILESARIDGASEIRIFLRLILPLGLPAIASLAIFQFLWTWNDLLVALTMARNMQPLTVAIFSNLRQFGSNIDLIAPAAFFSLAIPLAVFLAFQRYFAEGLLAGSVK